MRHRGRRLAALRYRGGKVQRINLKLNSHSCELGARPPLGLSQRLLTIDGCGGNRHHDAIRFRGTRLGWRGRLPRPRAAVAPMNDPWCPIAGCPRDPVRSSDHVRVAVSHEPQRRWPRGRTRTGRKCGRSTYALFLASIWRPLSFSIMMARANRATPGSAKDAEY